MFSLLERVSIVGARRLGFDLKRRKSPAVRVSDHLVGLRDDLAQVDSEAGDFLRFCLGHMAESHSQILQDLFVLWVLNEKRDGFFVEFGATDGLTGSNSAMLEKRFGWRGIVAEPGRIWHDRLRASRQCVIDTRCVAATSGEHVTFNQAERPELSTMSSFNTSDFYSSRRRRGTRYGVETVSLNDLLAEHGAPATIDYLSVDTEGSELSILQAFDLGHYRPRIVTVEHNYSPARDALFRLLSQNGYRRRLEELSQVDDWYVREV
jgi:FkbM family methyltransferase